MTLEKQPFVRYSLEGEGYSYDGKRVILTISLNEKERAKIREMQEILDIKSSGKVLKEMAFVGYKCITSTFGSKFLRYLFKKKRARLSNWEDF